MKKLITCLLMVLISTALAGKARSQNVDERVRLLEKQVQAIRNGSIQSNTGAAQIANSLEELKLEFSALKGSIDANTHLIDSSTQSVDLRVRDMEARMQALEERLAIQTKQVTAAVSTVAPEAADEASAYQTALDQVNNSEFLKAVASFKKFLKTYPKSDLADNAQFWVAECYFAIRDFETAIKQYQALKDNYPRSEKIPAAYLKQGYSFIELDMTADAKLFLQKVVQSYPRTPEAKQAKDRLSRLERPQETITPAPGNIPLAPGVEVPDKSKGSTPEKYR